MILGSEGNLGIATEIVFKIKNAPEIKKYGSILFHTFEEGC